MTGGPSGWGCPPAERLARLALSLFEEPGDPQLCAFTHEFGTARLLDALARGEQLADDRRWPKRWSRASAPAAADQAMATAEKLLATVGGTLRWSCPGDAEWPPGLDDLDHVQPLSGRGAAPLGLWLRGPHHLTRVAARSVAIVGSRASTSYGNQVAGDLAAEAADRGIAVVSGAAYGVDSAAHRGALAVNGRTVAVLACGADVAYPRAHESMLARIGAEGLIVSELAPAATPTRLRFLARNRLIAALATGTVVVEAAWRSGALNTLNWAGSLGRVTMGVPGPVTSSTSNGVHRLIRDGAAQLVTTGAEIAESIAALGTDTCPWVHGNQRLLDDLDVAARAVMEALPARRSCGVDLIAEASRMDADDVAAILGRLLLAGLVERTGDGWRLSNDASVALQDS